MSQDSRNGEMFWPAAKAAVHKGAMSEPVRRAHRVKIHKPPETRRGIFSRMSSTDSRHMGSSPSVKEDSFDLDSPPQTSGINGPAPGSQNPIQEEFENEQKESALLTCAEPEQRGQHQELSEEPDASTQPDTRTDAVPRPEPEASSPALIPPSSPARLRRTLETPVRPLPPSPVRTKVRSHTCPGKQTNAAQTPTVLRKHAIRLQTQALLHGGSSGRQMGPIPNGLCLSDSTDSSSDASIEEMAPPGGPDEAEQREGTLQREMKALFNQRMTEIRCKSPLFF